MRSLHEEPGTGPGPTCLSEPPIPGEQLLGESRVSAGAWLGRIILQGI